jgi:hypothetical protein
MTTGIKPLLEEGAPTTFDCTQEQARSPCEAPPIFAIIRSVFVKIFRGVTSLSFHGILKLHENWLST